MFSGQPLDVAWKSYLRSVFGQVGSVDTSEVTEAIPKTNFHDNRVCHVDNYFHYFTLHAYND